VQGLRATDPRTIGPYEVRGRLGSGGMGEVYLAESRTGLRLAVKVVRSEYAEDRTFRARFRQEVRAAQTVGGTGTYTARVVDADPEGERPWMATEFVDGPNLRDAVLDGGALPEPAVRVLAAALGEALGAIHAKGLVHRDLKPSNILLAPDGPRVIDFGIVRALEATAMTRTGAIVGSVGYVSPEQIRNGGKVGPPSDVFSLGAVLAYAASGREPFGEGQDSVILLRILTRDFDLAGVPAGLLPLVEPCLRDEPAERPTPEAVVTAAGHTARSLRDGVRPGWYAAGGPEPEAVGSDERWLPERESGERESRVEYVAPMTVTDVPSVTVVPPAPSRRGLLRALTGGAVVAAGGVGGWLWLRDGDSGAGSAGNGPETPTKASKAGRERTGPAAVGWEYPCGTLGGMYGPCVAVSGDGSTVYAGDQKGTLYALSRNGDERWKTKLGDEVQTPVVTGDGVFCTVWDQGRDRRLLVGVDLAGKRMWSHAVGADSYYMPALVGDAVLVGTGDTDEGGLRLYAADGSLLWDVRMPAGLTETPLVMDGVVYAGSFGDRLMAYDAADGTLRWAAPAGADTGRPVLVTDTLVVGSSGEENLHGISLDGEPLWSRAVDSEGAWMAATSSLAVGTSGGMVTGVAKDGSTAWTYETAVDNASDPVVGGDRIYVQAGAVIHALDQDGKQVWKATGAYGPGADETHRPVLHGRRLYVPSARGIAAVDITG
jgi:outer membrane protein assembly factor BamB